MYVLHECRGANGVTALMLAAKRGSVMLVKALLELGANVDLVDDIGCTAMHYCCQYNGKADITLGGNETPAVLDLLIAKGLHVRSSPFLQPKYWSGHQCFLFQKLNQMFFWIL